MSKEKYIEPKIEVIKFATADIITTSTGAFDGEWVPIGGESDEEVFLISTTYIEGRNQYEKTKFDFSFCPLGIHPRGLR